MKPSPFFSGLTSQQALENQQKLGSNTIVSSSTGNRVLASIWEQMKTPIHITLFAAAFFAALFGEVRDAIIILLMVVLSGIMDVFQEYRSYNIAQKLAARLARECTVVRDGKELVIPISDVTIGDVILLRIGDIPPADGTMLGGDSLTLNESALTGESFPVEKSEHDTIFAGTHVAAGWGYIQITAIGSQTQFGSISTQTTKKHRADAYQQGIRDFSMLILKATAAIVASVLVINLTKIGFSGQITAEQIFQIILFSVTIAVGLAPELLPVIMSVNMARGSMVMSKKGVLVKKLDAIPDFGSMNILCTDKTGTLTEDNITLIHSLGVDGQESVTVLEMASLNSYFQTGLKNPLDAAILNRLKSNPVDVTKIDEIPYDFERKCMSVIVSKSTENSFTKTQIITKGQPDEIVKMCTTYILDNKSVPFNESIQKSFLHKYEELSKQGFRVLAVCSRIVDNQEHSFDKKSEENMNLIGLLAFLDPAKKSAKQALKRLEEYGVSIKIITGDNEYITQKICADLGLPSSKFITGEQFELLKKNNPPEVSDLLYQQVLNCGIFARFNPHQKQEIIDILQAGGNVVGYMGDGINDTPSLQAADVGISVSNAVDVAKESADIILLNKNLDTLIDGVLEGRKTFSNTIKYMLMAISSNFGNMLSMVGAALFLPFLPMLPVQVLLNNSLYDLSQVAIPTDSVDDDYLRTPQKWDIRFLQKFMLVFGVLSTLFDFATFFVLYKVFNLPVETFQTAWFLESLATQVLVIYIIRTKKTPFLQSRPSLWLTLNTLLMVGIGVFIATTSAGLSFGFQPLSLQIFASIMGIVLLYLVLAELLKRWFYRNLTLLHI